MDIWSKETWIYFKTSEVPTGIPARSKYTSDPGQPRTLVLNRLDDPSAPDYHEGDFSRFLANLLNVGKQAFDYLQDQIDKVTEVAREKEHANLGEVTET